jgi:methylglutaconyl-CoA hydratase
MTRELDAHLSAAMNDSEVRVVVVTGTGQAFCAGADLKGSPGVGRDPFPDILRRMWEGPKPVIAAVNGLAFGGGLGLVAAADIAIAVDHAVFSFSEVRIGVIPAIISVFVLPKLGPHHAMRLFLTGERFDAAKAVEYGLVHRTAPAEGLEAAVVAEIDAISQGGPKALAEVKQLIRKVPTLSLEEALEHATSKSRELFRSEEATEGMKAFAQRRKPGWVK